MNLLYQTIALILWILFVSYITQDADAKRYKYKRTYSRREKIISNTATGIALIKGFSKSSGQKQIKNND